MTPEEVLAAALSGTEEGMAKARRYVGRLPEAPGQPVTKDKEPEEPGTTDKQG